MNPCIFLSRASIHKGYKRLHSAVVSLFASRSFSSFKCKDGLVAIVVPRNLALFLIAISLWLVLPGTPGPTSNIWHSYQIHMEIALCVVSSFTGYVGRGFIRILTHSWTLGWVHLIQMGCPTHSLPC